MILNLKELNTQAIETTTNATNMRLSEHASSMVFQLFTKNVYSNAIGTVIREITSNSFDSHVEANVDLPVIVRKTVDTETNSDYISFIDFGMGMSPDRIMNIYGIYFESTKRTDNNQIGGFGIGGKTPLAYKRRTGLGEAEYDNSFNVITTYNGIKYYYLIFEGAESPAIVPLHEEPTTEHNGTEIRVPVDKKDWSKFNSEVIKQLYYFENLVFEGFDNDEELNNYKIIKGKSFLYRGDKCNNNIHVCLGKVAYPIDYHILGLNTYNYNVPVAIKLEVGDIEVTVSREQLDYSEATITLLKAKLDEVILELSSMLSDQYDGVVTYEDYRNITNGFSTLKFNDKQSIQLSTIIDDVKGFKFKNYKYSSIHSSDSDIFNALFTSTMYGKRVNRYNSSNTFNKNYSDLIRLNNVYFVDGEFERDVKLQRYLTSLHTRFYVVTKKKYLEC